MKTLLLLTFILSSQAFAFDPCLYSETREFTRELEALNLEPVHVSNNHKKFRFNEKQMIHLTVSLQDWLKGASRHEALNIFTIDSSDGEILYYRFGDKTIALVHYWPGDNEYGAFFEMKNNAFRLLAEIRDSGIYCE